MQFCDYMAFPHHHPQAFLFHSQEDNDPLPSPSSLSSLPSCPPQLFPGSGGHFLMKRSVSFPGLEKCEEDELSDDGSQLLGEKKKRLNLEQVKALEKSFEFGNKLEPERKMQLAKILGLQPRQIAIWFQNRRARWKTKQLEKDFQLLKKQFDAIKADNDALQAHNTKLHAELMALKSSRDASEAKPKKEKEGRWSNGSENSCEANVSTTQLATKHLFTTTTSTRPTQLLHNSSIQHENFCNMFTGVDEHQGFWPWQEQQQQQQQHASFSLNQTQFSNN